MGLQGQGNRFRTQRFGWFVSLLDTIAPAGGPVRVLDVGGSMRYWNAHEPQWRGRDLDITIINIGAAPSDDGQYHVRPGNACALEFADHSFDVIHSNSVIEHVGHWAQMSAMAKEVRRVAPHYFVQTPNYWFPMEPHYGTLFFHWYPEARRAKMLAGRKRGFRQAADFDAAMRNIQDINLLTATQLAALFPDAEIKRERVGPLTKSLVAVK